MRCCCCNTNLNDFESTLRSVATGDFLDMCRKCLRDLDIETKSNGNDPDEQAPDDEHYWDMDEVEILTYDVSDEDVL
jgi:hypothetical protein